MKNKRCSAILGAALCLCSAAFAGDGISGFIANNAPGTRIKSLPDGFSKATDDTYKGFIDGFDMEVVVDGSNRIIRLYGRRDFNMGDMTAKQVYGQLANSASSRLINKLGGAISDDSSRNSDRPTIIETGRYSKCSYTDLGGGGRTVEFKSKDYKFHVSYWLGKKVYCDSIPDATKAGYDTINSNANVEFGFFKP